MLETGHGKICYLEIPAKDIQESAAFYAKVFGWTVRQRGGWEHRVRRRSGRQVSGTWVLGLPPSQSLGVLVHIMVHDAEQTIRDLIAAGGTLVQAIGAHHPEITARFHDPSSNLFGIYQEPRR